LGRQAAARLELLHRLGQELGVQVEADGGDMAALARPEDVAGAPDFQVAHGNLKAGSQIVVLLDRLQALDGILAQFAPGRVEEVSVGALRAASHTAA